MSILDNVREIVPDTKWGRDGKPHLANKHKPCVICERPSNMRCHVCKRSVCPPKAKRCKYDCLASHVEDQS